MASTNIQTVTLSGYSATVEGANYLCLGTWDSYGIEQLQINPGPEWDGLVIKATFNTSAGATPVVVPESGLIDVPPEATAQALTVGAPGLLVFSGTTDGQQRITCNLMFIVRDHAPIDGTAPAPTPDEWQQFVAMVQQYAQQAAQSATEAAGSATQAAQAETNAAASATAAAAELAKVQGAGTAALTAIGNAQSTAVSAVQTAQTTATQAVEQAGQTAVQQVQQAGTAQVNAVNQAGDAKLAEIQEVNAMLPAPTEADAGKAVVVNPDGSGYALGDVQVDAYTKAQSDARYAPIESAIKVSGSGTGMVSLSPTVAWQPQGMKLYGRSWQDGTPSVEQEVPIEGAGQSGTVDVTVCGENLLNTDELINNMQYLPNTGALSTLNGRVSTPKIKNPGVPIYVYATAGYSVILVQYDKSGALISCTFPNKNTKINLDAKCAEFAFTVYTSLGDGIVDYDTLKQDFVIGVALVSKYYPYATPQQLPIPTPDGLPGIPVDSGGNWTDENGQQWATDAVDMAAQEKTQRIFKGSLNALSGWAVSSDGLRIFTRLTGLGVQESVSTPVISNYFPGGSWKFQQKGTIAVGNGSAGSVVSVSTGDFPTVEDLENWLSEHACVYYTLLKNLVTTPLNPDTIAAYKALQSYPGTTNILAPDCGIEASAVGNGTAILADINAKITALQSAAAGT